MLMLPPDRMTMLVVQQGDPPLPAREEQRLNACAYNSSVVPGVRNWEELQHLMKHLGDLTLLPEVRPSDSVGQGHPSAALPKHYPCESLLVHKAIIFAVTGVDWKLAKEDLKKEEFLAMSDCETQRLMKLLFKYVRSHPVIARHGLLPELSKWIQQVIPKPVAFAFLNKKLSGAKSFMALLQAIRIQGFRDLEQMLAMEGVTTGELAFLEAVRSGGPVEEDVYRARYISWKELTAELTGRISSYAPESLPTF